MATAAIKPSAEVACKLCRGGAVKTEGQRLKASQLKLRFWCALNAERILLALG